MSDAELPARLMALAMRLEVQGKDMSALSCANVAGKLVAGEDARQEAESLDALYYVATATLDLPTSRQVGASLCRVVLTNLVAHASDAGETWVSDRTQADELGLDRRDVRNARDLLRAAGIEQDTGKVRGKAKVYALNLPGYSWKKNAELLLKVLR